MSVLIGHASIDENGKDHGGKSGDQTGKEVCTRNYYNSNWGFVLRAKDATLAEKMAKACEAGCANPNIGYDQYQRNTLNTEAKKVGYDLSVVGKCECDCSSFMTVCAQAAGINIPYTNGNAPTTRTMKSDFLLTGAFYCLMDKQYLESDKLLMRGDILVRPGHHTVMVLTDGSGVKETTYFPRYNGNSVSIVDGLNAVGADSSKAYRKKIAKANGIMVYLGTSKQNTELLTKLKFGKLIKP